MGGGNEDIILEDESPNQQQEEEDALLSAAKSFDSGSMKDDSEKDDNTLEEEEEKALEQVEQLLNVVEGLLAEGEEKKQGEEEEEESTKSAAKETATKDDAGEGKDKPTSSEKEQENDDADDVKSNASKNPVRRASLITVSLLRKLRHQRHRVRDIRRKIKTIGKLSVKGVRDVQETMDPTKYLGKHPVVIKTRDTTRRIVTGSRETRVRDYVVLPRVVRVLDKFTFTFGVLGIMLTELVLLDFPDYFRYYFLAIMGPMLLLRYILYHRAKWQYFLLDFCYWVNGLCFVLILFPQIQLPTLLLSTASAGGHNNTLWWQTLFVCANGPLISAIVTWNNSLVFHSVDKVTSVYIHALPALLTWCERWRHLKSPTYYEDIDHTSISFQGHILHPVLFYLLWQIVYLLQTEVIDKAKLDSDPEIATSLRFLTQSTKLAINKAVLRLCRSIGVMGSKETFYPPRFKVKIIFVTFQFVYTVIMFLPTSLYYNYMWIHSFVLMYVLTTSIYNGARYYVQVFSKIFEKRYDETKNAGQQGAAENGNDYFAEISDGEDEEEEEEENDIVEEKEKNVSGEKDRDKVEKTDEQGIKQQKE